MEGAQRSTPVPEERETLALHDAWCEGVVVFGAAGDVRATNEAGKALLASLDAAVLETRILPTVARAEEAGTASLVLAAESGRRFFEALLARRHGEVLAVFRDITAQRRAEARLKLAAKAGALLSATLDLEPTLRHVAEVALPMLGDCCIVDLLQPNGTLGRVAVAHVDPEKRDAFAAALGALPSSEDSEQLVRRALWTGEALLVPAGEPADLGLRLDDDSRAFTPRSLVCAPMSLGGEPLGTLRFAFCGERGPVHGEGERELAQLIAERAAVAIRNAILHEERRRAAERLQVDVNELKAHEEALERAWNTEHALRGEAEQARALVELFIGILGHDLRTPLTAILLNAESLRRRFQDEALAQPLQRLVRSAERASRLVDQLLDVTRARTGKGIAIQRRELDLGELARVALEETASTRVERRLSLEAEGDLKGSWDGDRLAQVLGNLLANAVAHGADPVVLRLDGRTRDEVSFEVHNQGVIPADQLPRLFDPFKQANRRDGAGLGLGLFIAQQIVLAHGGAIDVSSSEEDGTRVRVLLPRAIRLAA